MMPGDHLAAMLDGELNCLRHLQDALAAEHEALLAADAPAIERATAAKNRSLGEQATLMQRRQDYLLEAGFAASSEGLADCIRGCANAARLQDLRSELNTLLQACHEANRLNGRLIGHRQQQTQSVLNILRQAEQAPATYTDAGGAVNTGPNRLIGKA